MICLLFGLGGFAGSLVCFGWWWDCCWFAELWCFCGCGMSFLVVGFDLAQVFAILVLPVVLGSAGVLCFTVWVFGVFSDLVDVL